MNTRYVPQRKIDTKRTFVHLRGLKVGETVKIDLHAFALDDSPNNSCSWISQSIRHEGIAGPGVEWHIHESDVDDHSSYPCGWRAWSWDNQHVGIWKTVAQHAGIFGVEPNFLLFWMARVSGSLASRIGKLWVAFYKRMEFHKSAIFFQIFNPISGLRWFFTYLAWLWVLSL